MAIRPKREIPNYSYDTITMDLSIARDGFLMSIAGNYIKAVEATDIDTNINIALNDSTRDTIEMHKGRSIQGKFFDLYFYNDAQAGKTITLVIASLVSISIEDDGVVGDIDTIQEIIYPPVPTIQALYDKLDREGKNPSFNVYDIVKTMTASTDYTLLAVPADKIWYIYGACILPHGMSTADVEVTMKINDLTSHQQILASYFQRASVPTPNGANFSDFAPFVSIKMEATWIVLLECVFGVSAQVRGQYNYIQADA
ncbi:hypothetical protein GOV14_03515 [Candidatus Pacearchaeota archaeon]|nr:hypothetical protein [Candidatus Pacearchaeota archaeon]